MKKLIILGLIISSVAFSATKDNLNRFEAGDAASASDVMENFDDLADAIDTNTASIANKADQSSVDTNTTAIASKADASDLADKADKSYVDTQLASKADKNYVDNKLSGNTIYWEKKELSSDIRDNSTDISDLRFNNLEVGKTYRITISAYLYTRNHHWARLQAVHDGEMITQILNLNEEPDWIGRHSGNSTIFTATASTLKAVIYFNGDEYDDGILSGGKNTTYIILEELPYHSATTKF